MAINKVVYDGNTLLDLSEDTATADKILYGYTAHDHTGEAIVGTAAGEVGNVGTLEEFLESYGSDAGFLLFYSNATTGTTYVTNTVTTSKGIYVETANEKQASRWYFELVSGYTNRFNIYTYVGNEKLYMYNNTAGGANFMGLSAESKADFDITCEKTNKFLLKITTKNAWLQHSKSGGGIRLYTDHNDANNSLFTFVYQQNAIVPYGTLIISENGTYDVYNYKTVVVSV